MFCMTPSEHLERRLRRRPVCRTQHDSCQRVPPVTAEISRALPSREARSAQAQPTVVYRTGGEMPQSGAGCNSPRQRLRGFSERLAMGGGSTARRLSASRRKRLASEVGDSESAPGTLSAVPGASTRIVGGASSMPHSESAARTQELDAYAPPEIATRGARRRRAQSRPRSPEHVGALDSRRRIHRVGRLSFDALSRGI